MMVGVAFFAMAMGLALLQSQNHSLRQEVGSLRSELGHLVPVDDSKVNIIEVPTQSKYIWRWRIFAPEGTSFDAGIAAERIPRIGTPEPLHLGLQIPSKPHGVLITASVTSDIETGYVLTLDCGNGNVVRDRTLLPRDQFLDGSASLATVGRSGPQACEFDEPIILHRRRLLEQTSPTTCADPEGNARGLIFWITPKKKP